MIDASRRFEGLFDPMDGGLGDASFVGDFPDGQAVVKQRLDTGSIGVFEFAKGPRSDPSRISSFASKGLAGSPWKPRVFSR